MKKYDTLMIGHISKDTIIDLEGTLNTVGGAVIYSAASAAVAGKVGVVTKTAPSERLDLLKYLRVEDPDQDIFYQPSTVSTAIRNQYFSQDRERRTCQALTIADPFTRSDIPEVDSSIYHLAGLIFGDIPESLIDDLAMRGKVAVDVQGFVRHSVDGEMVFFDWKDKRKYLPKIEYFKTDAAEAELLTGESDIFLAAKKMHDWGAREVMVTHNTQVVLCSDEGTFSSPIRSRNFSGRTGRGDTCFSAYYIWRQNHSSEEATQYAAALVSLKMETPGPFTGHYSDVENYIQRFY